jgi:hypothetical protein
MNNYIVASATFFRLNVMVLCSSTTKCYLYYNYIE